MYGSISVRLALVLALGACASSGGGSGSGANAGAGNAAAVSTVNGAPVDSDVAVSSLSASYDSATDLVGTYTNDFTLRSRDEYRLAGEFRRFRYGKPRKTYSPKRNYTVPLTLADQGGLMVGTGTATFSGDEVEDSVTTRVFTVTDVVQASSVFGIFSTEDTGTAPRQDFFEIHAYSAGIPATALPNTANYSGRFFANVISDGASGTTAQINLPANLNVNFIGGLVSGTVGAVASPDLTLNGTVSATDVTGTVTVSGAGIPMANGTTGTFNGGFYGAGAAEVAATVGITDTSGTANKELVGAFGGSRN